jgi:hypothetical protein
MAFKVGFSCECFCTDALRFLVDAVTPPANVWLFCRMHLYYSNKFCFGSQWKKDELVRGSLRINNGTTPELMFRTSSAAAMSLALEQPKSSYVWSNWIRASQIERRSPERSFTESSGILPRDIPPILGGYYLWGAAEGSTLICYYCHQTRFLLPGPTSSFEHEICDYFLNRS